MPINFAQRAAQASELASAPVNALWDQMDRNKVLGQRDEELRQRAIERNATVQQQQQQEGVAQHLVEVKQGLTRAQWLLDKAQNPDLIATLRSNPTNAKVLSQGLGIDVLNSPEPVVRTALTRFMQDKAAELGMGPPSPDYGQPVAAVGPEGTGLYRYSKGSLEPQRVPGLMPVPKDVNPGGGSNVTVKMAPQESAENKKVGEEFGQMYVDTQKAGSQAYGKIARLDRLANLLQGVETGKLAPATTTLAAYAESFGIKVDPKLPAKQAVNSITGEMALQMRNPSGGAGMPGAMSDKDREFLMSIVPGLSNTPAGNALIIETYKRLAQRDTEVAKMARDYRIRNGQLNDGFYAELQQFSEANPLFQVGGSQQPVSRPAQPVSRPTGGSSDFVVGKTYTDAQGNKATYRGNGQWEQH